LPRIEYTSQKTRPAITTASADPANATQVALAARSLVTAITSAQFTATKRSRISVCWSCTARIVRIQISAIKATATMVTPTPAASSTVPMRPGRTDSTGTSLDGLQRAEGEPVQRRRLKLPLIRYRCTTS
jgi:hypothetical protein